MNPAEFANIARAERDFWWYLGMRRILFRLLRGRSVRNPADSAAPLSRFKVASGVEPVPAWLDRLLYAPLHLESAMVGSGMSFITGQSILLLTRKRVSKAAIPDRR